MQGNSLHEEIHFPFEFQVDSIHNNVPFAQAYLLLPWQ